MPPLCTVIIPVYEHWHLIPALVQCLQRQKLSQESFEVLLVDNGSTHFSPPAELPGNICILHCAT
ncbi:glycosyltransferase family 2 protein [Halomonas sp. MA07-2]|uniref:glycosyltransferase family 2 protein n=1 Tax=Halomonas sp. MA07-2 TaxID=3440841 RepID=UPI003EE8C428